MGAETYRSYATGGGFGIETSANLVEVAARVNSILKALLTDDERGPGCGVIVDGGSLVTDKLELRTTEDGWQVTRPDEQHLQPWMAEILRLLRRHGS